MYEYIYVYIYVCKREYKAAFPVEKEKAEK